MNNERQENLFVNHIEERKKMKKEITHGFSDKMEFMNATLSLMGSQGMTQYIYSMYPEYIFIEDGGENIV